MTFLNVTLLTGLLAITIPIVLHMIARRQPKLVTFPAIRFLKQRAESNRSKLNVKRWWLLAMRIAAIAALAIALAGPIIHRSVSTTWISLAIVGFAGLVLLVLATFALVARRQKSLVYGLAGTGLVALLGSGGGVFATILSSERVDISGTDPLAICIVIDNSPASSWKTANDDRMAEMKSAASAIVSRLPPTSRVSIVDRSAAPAVFSLDAAGALSKIGNVIPIQSTLPLESRIRAATELLRTSELQSKQIVVLSGLTRASWLSVVDDASLSVSLAQEPTVSLSVVDAGGFDAINRSIGVPRFDASPPSEASSKVTARVSVAAPQTSPVSVTIEMLVYDDESTLPVVRNGTVVRPKLTRVDRKNVSVVPGGGIDVDLTLPPLALGIRHGVLRLVGGDALELDDERYFTVDIKPPPMILIVANNVSPLDVDRNVLSSERLEPTGDAHVMQKVIEAFFMRGLDGAANDSTDQYIQSITPDDLAAVQLDGYQCVVLIDPDLQTLQDESLVDYVADGGGMLQLIGPNAGLSKIELPLVCDLQRPWNSPTPGTFFEISAVSHPIFRILRGDDGQLRWSDFRVHRYWQVNPKPQAVTLATYAGTSHPAILQQPFGEGNVLTVTTPLPALDEETRPWNDLFGASDVWPAFTLIAQSVNYLIGSRSESTTAQLGQPFLVSGLSSRAAQVDVSDVGSQGFVRWQLFPPGNNPPVPLDVATDSDEASVSQISRAGTYFIRRGKQNTGFAANLPATATTLTRIDNDELIDSFGDAGCRIVSDVAELQFRSSSAQTAISLRSPMLLLAVVIFLLEQLISNRFYGRRESTAGASAA